MITVSKSDRRIMVPVQGMADLAGVWVVIHLLQVHGCGLPVILAVDEQFYIKGVLQPLFEKTGSVQIHAVRMARQAGRGAWKLAVRAALDLGVDEVLILDPQTVPCRNPDYLFACAEFAEHGALFWPKFVSPVERTNLFRAMAVPPKHCPEVDDSQLLLAVRRHVAVLHLALQLAELPWAVEAMWGNSADVLQFAFSRLGAGFCAITSRPVCLSSFAPDQSMVLAGLCYLDLHEEVLFQNRRYRPWMLVGTMGVGGGMFEPQCFQFLKALRARLTVILGLSAGEDAEVCRGRWLLDLSPAGGGGAARKLAGAETHSVLNFDDWVTLKLAKDGVCESSAESELVFWKLSGEDRQSLELLDVNLHPLAVLHAAEEWRYEGTWSRTGEVCRLVREVVLDFERHDQPAFAPAQTSRGRVDLSLPIHLVSERETLADAVSTLLCACSVASAGQDVVWHTSHAEWFHRVAHQRLAIARPRQTPEGGIEPQLNENLEIHFRCVDRNLEVSMRRCIGPAAAKCRAFDPAMRPSVPQMMDLRIRVPRLDFLRYVLIVPYADDPRHDWPVSHWRRLIALLRDHGLDVVAIGQGDHADRFARDFSASCAFWASGPDAEWSVDVLLGSAAVIAPQSGLSYLAALHGVRTVMLAAEVTQAFIPAALPIDLITGSASCRACWRDEEKGFSASCHAHCLGMTFIDPEEVAARLFASMEPDESLQ